MKPIPSFWQQTQRKIKWRINLTLWGERFLPLFFLFSSLTALLFYLFRRWGENPLWPGLALIPILAGLAIYVYVRLKRNFFTRQDTLAFLDDKLQLNTRLSLANSGKGEWPDEQRLAPCLKWRSPLPFILWPVSSLILIALSLSIPLPASVTSTPYTSAPPALEQVDKWMEALSQMKELDQEQLEELEEKVQSLLERPNEEMYTHSALEAAESLKEQMDQEMKEFSQNLKRFQDALSSAQNEDAAQTNNAQANEDSLKSAMEAMDGKNLQLSKDALNPAKGNNGPAQKQSAKGGKNFSPNKMSQMSDAQKQKLKDMAQRAREQLEALNQSLKDCNGNCDSLGNGNGNGPGKGGPGGGGGAAPLALGKTAPEINMEKEDLLSDPNAEITLGEKIGEQSGIFDVQDDGKRASSAGKVRKPSSGGQTTWEEQYTPAEKEALKNFFK